MGDDEALLDVVTSANVACGFHAGDPATMLRTCRAAAARGVTVGAHPSYPDLVGFGRRHLSVTPSELTAMTIYQLGALAACCTAAGTRLAYVKPHGALYHDLSRDVELARAFILGVAELAPLAVLGPAGSELLAAAADLGLPTAAEVFADRGYRADGTLVPRSEPHALVESEDEVARRVVAMVTRGTVQAVDGSDVRVVADSVCLHSDTPGAVALARRVRTALEAAGVELSPFA
ncbi:MAG TPA: 5-oxoprolinase subunit PxpA [Propionibacteriaceae bacterium]|nr:5-oxoprolinase subunit PxpA [Propionibacteriaceae bacterium]